MNYWIISDTHFGHDKLIAKGYRPSNCYALMMNSILNLSEKDVLIHLGDVAFKRSEWWHNRLTSLCKCKMWLVKGNHDKKSNNWYLSNGWDFVADSFHMRIYGKNIVFSHVPMELDWDSNIINVHGHLHECTHRDTSCLTENHFLVKMEHEYKPIKLRKLIGM